MKLYEIAAGGRVHAGLDAGREAALDALSRMKDAVAAASAAEPGLVDDFKTVLHFLEQLGADVGSVPEGDVVVTWAVDEIVLVSRQDEEGRILKIIAEKGKPPSSAGLRMEGRAMSELKPCPFCGGVAHRRELIEHYPASADGPAGSYSAWFYIGCDACGIELSDEYESTVAEAWNRRAAYGVDTSRGAKSRQIEDCPELNLSNYDADDVVRLNDWAVRADAEIERLRHADGVSAVDRQTFPPHTPMQAGKEVKE